MTLLRTPNMREREREKWVESKKRDRIDEEKGRLG
jgi:hypothetical protein